MGPSPPSRDQPPPPMGSFAYPARAPYPARRGLSLTAFLAVVFGLAGVVLVTALVVVTALFVRERDRKEAARSAATRGADDEGSPSTETHADLPTVTRHVPNHSLRVLEGCTDANLGTISGVLADAIDQGAPEYNDGKFVDSYKTYVGAALDLERRLPKACSGPSRALENGRHTASHMDHASEQAWAMRDAFDGLLDVIARSRQGGGTSL